jgi:hypothetical protein
MAGRPTNTQAQATRAIGATPNFSVFGWGVQSDLFSGVSSLALTRDMRLMAEEDETIGAMLWCISTVMAQIVWEYVPQVNGTDTPDNAEAKRYAELATTMLHDMDRPFSEHIDDALTMLWASFAPCEIVTKRRDGINSKYSDGFYGLEALNLLDQATIWDWKYNGHKLVAMQQQAPTLSNDGMIPLYKVLLYRTNAQYNNPRGKPMLKPAWRVWRLKRKVQDSEAIGIERDLCGLPIFEVPEDLFDDQFEVDADDEPTDAAKKARAMIRGAQDAVRDMRFNKSGGLVHPSNTYSDEVPTDITKRFNFRIQTTGGQRSIDSRTAARDYDHAIARVAMMQFLTLGQRSGGSYGLSEDQSSMAVNSIMAIANRIVAEWNNKVTPLLWTVNAFPPQYRPRLRHSDVNKNGIAQIGAFMSGLGKAADLWGGDAKMRVGLAKQANLPYDYDAQVAAAATYQQAKQGEADAAEAGADAILDPPAPTPSKDTET